MKPQNRQHLTFRVSAKTGNQLLAARTLASAQVVQRSERELVDQFFLAGLPSDQAKPAKTVFRLRQDLTSGQCFADMRTFKKTKSKLRRTTIGTSELQDLLLCPHDRTLRPASWKVDSNKTLHPNVEARFSRTAVDLDGGSSLTVDRAIRCRMLDRDSLVSYSPIDNVCLVTMQFRDFLPSSFKRLVYDYRLDAQPVALVDLCIAAAASPLMVPSLREKHVA
ncbi:MAG: hypothetical protein Aurels2KO_43250 [Aureliella sp.]